MKRKLLKICLTPIVVAPCVLPITGCSLVDILAKRPRLIDGFDWTGRKTGLLRQYDDYEIDEEKKTVTYWNLGTLEAENLVIPNYVMWRGEKYKVALDIGAFQDGGSRITGTVELNDFITEIPANCFRNNSAITGIIFHDYPTKIGEFAFLNCYSLETIQVKTPNYVDDNWALKLKEVCISGFDNCSLKGNLIFGSQLEKISDRAFINCYQLTNVDFSMSTRLVEIGKGAFMSCSGLRNVYLPSSIQRVYDEAFAVCTNLETVTLPEQNMEISLSAYAFSECRNFRCFTYKNLDVPLKLKISYAGKACFNGDISLEPRDYLYQFDQGRLYGSYYIESTFEGCNFTNWKLDPSKVDYIESKVFAYNSNLKFIDLTAITENEGIPEGWIDDGMGTLTTDVFYFVSQYGTIFVRSGFMEGNTFAAWVKWFEDQGLEFNHENFTEPSLEHWNFQVR